MKTVIHPALKYSFTDLIIGLMEEVRKGIVKRTDKGNLSLFNYKIIQDKKEWNDFSMIARGIVLDIEQKRIIALPFPKFFNYGEVSSEIPPINFTAFEKLDGSLGIIYYANGDWQVNTRGSFDSWQAKKAKEMLDKYVNKQFLDRNCTYLAEIIIKGNQIVVDYPFEGLGLLSGYNNKTGVELPEYSISSITSKTFFFMPIRQNSSFEYLLRLSKSKRHNAEGFVVRFNNGYRVKIKYEEYLRIHRVISKVTPLGIWDMMKNNDDIEEVRSILPEEHIDKFDEIFKRLYGTYIILIDEIRNAEIESERLSDKAIGLKIKENPDKFSEIVRTFIFFARKGKFYDNVKIAGKTRNSLFKHFRPTENEYHENTVKIKTCMYIVKCLKETKEVIKNYKKGI